jgi:D-glycero-alpha-D-manno-heptose-7-phosphate kinase
MGCETLIITRTPYRLSFFGGGSDYPAWFEKHGGCVLSTTIDKYCYISVRWLPPFFEHKHHIVWSQIENVNTLDEIKNHVVRECLKSLDIDKGISITHDGDLPARSGMGSSSAFTVGLLNALYHLQNCAPSGVFLAEEAYYTEKELIKENIGYQDQVACAIGGLNRINFHEDGIFNCQKIDITPERKKELQSHLMLVFTGFPRTASEIAGTYNFDNSKYLSTIVNQVSDAQAILKNGDIRDFGQLLNEAWLAKKQLSNSITTPYIDFLYDNALKAGAIGGKVVGAGGGGFMLLFCEPDKQEAVKNALKGLLFVPFKFEDKGSQIILNNGNA